MSIVLIRRYLFFTLLIIFAVTFFTRNNCRYVKDISPAVLNPPIQKLLQNFQIIKFVQSGYGYELTPLYEYEINGLIVSKMNYKLFSIYKTASVFPMDLCLIWGSNVANRVYGNQAVKFSQDCRWCSVQWFGNISFNLGEISNNHLIINRKDIERKVNSLVVGDQVRLKGKLVNVKAQLISKGGSFDAEDISWNSSINRQDSGAGACEVIYVENIDVLKKANVLSYYLFQISLYGLIILILRSIISFFAEIVR